MLVDLVRVTTADGLRLDGALQSPPSGSSSDVADAALLVHGTGGSFYSSTLFETLAARLLSLGLAVLTVNTRGHDLVSTAATPDGPRRQGAAYEDVGRCRQDIAAWLDFLVDRGLRRVVLVGHSSGAIKAVYSQSTRPHAAVARVIALSPPRLSHAHFLASAKGAEFAALLADAQARVAQGRGDELMDVRFPLPYLVTAAGFVDKYGPDERYSVVPLVERLSVPTLLTFGSQEVATNVAFSGLPDAMSELSRLRPNIAIEVIAEADHFYSGRRDELATCLQRWLTLS